MATYLGAMHGATILTAGKKVDMAYIYAQKPTPICIRSGWMMKQSFQKNLTKIKIIILMMSSYFCFSHEPQSMARIG